MDIGLLQNAIEERLRQHGAGYENEPWFADVVHGAAEAALGVVGGAEPISDRERAQLAEMIATHERRFGERIEPATIRPTRGRYRLTDAEFKRLVELYYEATDPHEKYRLRHLVVWHTPAPWRIGWWLTGTRRKIRDLRASVESPDNAQEPHRFVADVVIIDGDPYSVVYDRQTGCFAATTDDIAPAMAANLNANPHEAVFYKLVGKHGRRNLARQLS